MKNSQIPNSKKLSHPLIAGAIAIASSATAVATQNFALAAASPLPVLVMLTQQNTRIESIVSQAMMPQPPLPAGVRGRTAIFIDGNNVDITAKKNNDVTIDYAQLLKHLSEEASLVSRPFYYYASHRNRNRAYLNEIEGYGYDIKKQEIQTYRNGDRAGSNIDPWMATDIAFHGLSAQKIVIVSGDGRAYIHALRYAKQQGKKVEVWFFKNSTSDRLLDEADRFVELLELPGVCIPGVCKSMRPRKRHETNNRTNSA
ncbi:NYN domain-containing protein [Oscillatoriales cyanobacterium LEGE 11467]|uniref:NYN domain-containing protein n=1 Tax=Zarconia navalis LEGE 11467 TaxID=1828826 RepID=A0A928VVL6_9CYAN|nr:NYN domain-containing protein [Zarconia navalis]MBE9040098.1 NYN domain-containing protein [Zarconia navalis LEGE 11467]